MVKSTSSSLNNLGPPLKGLTNNIVNTFVTRNIPDTTGDVFYNMLSKDRDQKFASQLSGTGVPDFAGAAKISSNILGVLAGETLASTIGNKLSSGTISDIGKLHATVVANGLKVIQYAANEKGFESDAQKVTDFDDNSKTTHNQKAILLDSIKAAVYANVFDELRTLNASDDATREIMGQMKTAMDQFNKNSAGNMVNLSKMIAGGGPSPGSVAATSFYDQEVVNVYPQVSDRLKRMVKNTDAGVVNFTEQLLTDMSTFRSGNRPSLATTISLNNNNNNNNNASRQSILTRPQKMTKSQKSYANKKK